MMVSPIEATIPRWITSRLISLMLKRESGSPSSLGSSQARAFTATTVPGGKDTRPALPREFLQAAKALLEEAFTPLAHDLARRIEARSDFVVIESLRCEQDDSCANNITIR